MSISIIIVAILMSQKPIKFPHIWNLTWIDSRVIIPARVFCSLSLNLALLTKVGLSFPFLSSSERESCKTKGEKEKAAVVFIPLALGYKGNEDKPYIHSKNKVTLDCMCVSTVTSIFLLNGKSLRDPKWHRGIRNKIYSTNITNQLHFIIGWLQY